VANLFRLGPAAIWDWGSAKGTAGSGVISDSRRPLPSGEEERARLGQGGQRGDPALIDPPISGAVWLDQTAAGGAVMTALLFFQGRVFRFGGGPGHR